MIDQTTQKSLMVSTAGTASPYIVVPESRLQTVRRVLDDHRVPYWVDENAISLGGEPEVTVVNLGRGADPKAVQMLLDSVP